MLRLLALSMLLLASPALAITFGQVDEFTADTEDWTSGFGNPNPPVRVAEGGPFGPMDPFLEIRARGAEDQGGRLVAFNRSQWTGDYTAAGVTEIRLWLDNVDCERNPGSCSVLEVRLGLRGVGGSFSTLGSVVLDTGGWIEARFPIRPQDLVACAEFLCDGPKALPGTDAEGTLAGVFELRILHRTTPGTSADVVDGALGVDRITAPEFSAPLPGLLTALAVVARRRVGRSSG